MDFSDVLVFRVFKLTSCSQTGSTLTVSQFDRSRMTSWGQRNRNQLSKTATSVHSHCLYLILEFNGQYAIFKSDLKPKNEEISKDQALFTFWSQGLHWRNEAIDTFYTLSYSLDSCDSNYVCQSTVMVMCNSLLITLPCFPTNIWAARNVIDTFLLANIFQ